MHPKMQFLCQVWSLGNNGLQGGGQSGHFGPGSTGQHNIDEPLQEFEREFCEHFHGNITCDNTGRCRV